MSPLEPSAMTDNSRLLASRFLALAEEIFARADRVHDADIREKICAIAAGYERLAQLVEDQSGEGQRSAPHAGGRRLALSPPRCISQVHSCRASGRLQRA